MNGKKLVLLSAGLDSTVNFLEALQDGGVKLALTFSYGQKASVKEIDQSQKLCQKHNVPHQVVDLPFFQKFTSTSLLRADKAIPLGSEVDIHSLERSFFTAEKVWVPNRNGIFLNIAAGFAEGLGIEEIVPGFNLEEATTFPDNSEEFQQALQSSFLYSTQNKVRVKCYTIRKNKTEILKRGLELGMEIEHLWPCYQAGDEWCGGCESCLRFQNALQKAGITK